MSPDGERHELDEATKALETALERLRRLRRKGGTPELEAAHAALEAAERHLRAVKRRMTELAEERDGEG